MAASRRKKRRVSGSLPTRGTYLRSLEVANVRCFAESQKLSLVGKDDEPARWTVILGENGVGKTTLLQLMALVCGPERYHRHMFELWDYEDGPGPPVEFSRGHDSHGALQAELIGNNDVRRVKFEIDGDDIRPQGMPLERELFVCGYGAGRRNAAGRFRHRSKRSRLKFASLFIDAPLRNAEEWLLGEDYAAAKEGGSGPAGRRLERLKELLVNLLPEVTDVRVSEARKRWEPGVDFRTPYGWVPLYGLSLGYQSFVAWVVDLAAAMFERYEKHADPLAEPAIVLVDEIDLHLHPKWQRELMPFLVEKFPNTQFVATAHSPLIVQAAEGANVVVLKRQGDQVVIENDPADVNNWRIDQILTSDLYGLPTARPPHLDALIAERRKLLTARSLTPAAERRLRAIEAEIGEMPGGETPDEMRAMELILKAANRLVPNAPGKKR